MAIQTASYSFYAQPLIPMPEGDGSGDGLGTCGEGTEWQANLHHRSEEYIQLFHVPKPGEVNHFKELARLAEKFNKKLNRKGMKLVRRLREELKDPTIEITVHLSRNGFQLVYAKTSPKGRPAQDALYEPPRARAPEMKVPPKASVRVAAKA